jgi:hypothetical protein
MSNIAFVRDRGRWSPGWHTGLRAEFFGDGVANDLVVQ